MNVNVIKAAIEHHDVIKNLMQFYIYDFSEYLQYDVEEDGLFSAYPNLEAYWKEGKNRFPYIIKQEEKYVGFALVRFVEFTGRDHFSIAEFFILRKYRRAGIGKSVAWQLFNLHRGQWQVYQREMNKPAQQFWHNIIEEYTKGSFKERTENGRLIQDFES